ncbi:MAG TPA: PAS domain S-box protein [Gemmataceae bacterium]|nr:PAS domain S-box protein [Gemmataceae bacterium]
MNHNQKQGSEADPLAFLTGGGEMGRLMRTHDWSATPLGPVSGWPQSLKTAVRIILGSRYPLFIWWGRQLVNLYNDGYLPVLGQRHPAALGKPAAVIWSEIWDTIGPQADAVLSEGQASWNEERLLVLERNGYPEEAYFTFSYSPVPADDGGVGGIFCALTEDTQRILGQRRLRTLRELSAKTTGARTVEQACRAATDSLAQNAHDLPFALIYLLDDQGQLARLAGTTGLADDSPAHPASIDLRSSDAGAACWPLDRVAATGRAELVVGLEARCGRLRCGAWPDPPQSAIVLPIMHSGQDRLAGFLVAGISPRRVFDDDYRGFTDLLAGHIATAITNARAYEEEKRRAEALAEIDRAKTMFFSNVSHEFRTPLTLMLGPVGDLLARSRTDLSPAAADQLEVVNRNGQRLLRLVNTLLDFSRIEAGRVRAVYQPTDLAAFTADLASVFRAAVEKAGLRLSIDCPPLGEPVFVDPEMWEKIVLNLLSNAFKFTFDGEIAVTLKRVGDAAELRVSDTGTGIPAEEMPRLFERFHRVHNARGRTHEGSGIGLALVQDLVRLHGGSIAAESVEGKGTTFTVTVPLGSAHLPPDQIGDGRSSALTGTGATPYIQEALRWLPDDTRDEQEDRSELPTYQEPLPTPYRRAQPDGADRPRVLVADDNADMRKYVTRLLAEAYRTETAADGEAALAAARRQRPDLILADVMMPRLDGFGLLREIRADPELSGLPVILLSARAGEESRVEGMEAGADDYLVKPFGARELLARVSAHLQMARLRRESERAVRESEERFRAFVSASSDVVYRMNADWSEMRFLRGRGLIGDTHAPSRTWLQEYIHPDDQPQVMKAIGEAIHGKSVFELEHRVVRLDGTVGWAFSRAVPLLGRDGEIVEWLGAASDVTARKRAEKELQQERDRLRVTLASIGDAVITTDTEGRITFLNGVAESLTGWTNAEAVGQPLDAVFRIVNEETRKPGENPAKRVLRRGVVVGLANHTVLIRKDGTERPIDDSAAPVLDGQGLVVGCVLVFRDIRERRRLEQENADRLRAASLLAAIVESSDDAIVSKSLDGIIQTWNAAAERLFGYTAEQAVGRHISLIIPPDRTDEEAGIIATLKTGQRIDHFDTVRLRSDGQPVLVSLTISPVKDEASRVIGASKIARDITGQRRAEERERRLLAEAATANAKFRAFFDQGPLFTGVMALDGTLLEANRLSLEACGYSKEQVIGKKFWECAWWSPSPELIETIKAASAQTAAGELFRAELPYYVADGSERVVDFILVPIKDETGRVLFLASTGTDITDRKRAEADRQKFVTLIENSTDFIAICDLAGIPFFVNRAGLEMVGLHGIEQARHTPIRDFFFPEDQARIMDEFFPSVLETGHGEMDVRFRHFRTGEARWMAYKVLTLTDAAGRPVGLATVSQDVTERRRLEDNLRKLASDLSEADRRKNEFLATLAHELRNPLAPIRNALQIIRLSPNREAREHARTLMERQLRQMVRLVDDLMDVSRITRGKVELRKEQVELAKVVQQAVETSRPLIEAMGHHLTLDMPPMPIVVNGDLTRLAQAFANLLNNAAKYTERGGRITLRVEQQGSDAVVSVRDTGVGIPAQMLPKVFELFTQVDHSLERSQGGLGIGLSLVKGMVEMHGGSVEARSAGHGMGSEFVVRLPVLLALAGEQRRDEADRQPTTPKARRRILVADDNRDSADSLALLLNIMGNNTQTVHDGLEVLEVAASFRPDVILLDIGMPKLNGYETARRIRQQPWGSNVLLVAQTGWGQEDDKRLSKEAGFDVHMVKPVDPAALEKLLSELQAGTA